MLVFKKCIDFTAIYINLLFIFNVYMQYRFTYSVIINAKFVSRDNPEAMIKAPCNLDDPL